MFLVEDPEPQNLQNIKCDIPGITISAESAATEEESMPGFGHVIPPWQTQPKEEEF